MGSTDANEDSHECGGRKLRKSDTCPELYNNNLRCGPIDRTNCNSPNSRSAQTSKTDAFETTTIGMATSSPIGIVAIT